MEIFKPYEGSEPYIFISYSHKNSDVVMPIIEKLASDGYRVWYDGGIELGSEWDENIALHIKNSSCVISMISKEYIESKNCKDELKYARNKDKAQFLIYLAPTILPEGMQMRLDTLQAAFKYAYSDENEFYSKIYDADMLEPCKGGKQSAGKVKIGQKQMPEPPLRQADTFNVCISWPVGFVWALGGSIFVTIDNTEPPFELKNGKSITLQIPSGMHRFYFCAKGYKVGYSIDCMVNKDICFICKPSTDAVVWGYFTKKPSVTVTQDVLRQ